MVIMNNQNAGILAGILASPGEESLETLKGMATQLDWLDEAVEELCETSLESWQGEHTRLFINGVPSTPCLPFASIWLHGTMHGQATVTINGIYQQAGLQSNMDMPDFLGTLLEAAAYLSTPSQIPEEKRVELFNQLWEDFLVSWIPKFANKLVQESRLELYRKLGQKLLDLVGEPDHE